MNILGGRWSAVGTAGLAAACCGGGGGGGLHGTHATHSLVKRPSNSCLAEHVRGERTLD